MAEPRHMNTRKLQMRRRCVGLRFILQCQEPREKSRAILQGKMEGLMCVFKRKFGMEKET